MRLAIIGSSKQAEGIAKAVIVAKTAGSRSFPGIVSGPGILPEAPGWTMAGYGITLPIGDFGVLHAFKIVVRFVVRLDMLEAEGVVLAFMRTALGGAMAAVLLAARPVARRQFAARQSFFARFDAHLVEIF